MTDKRPLFVLVLVVAILGGSVALTRNGQPPADSASADTPTTSSTTSTSIDPSTPTLVPTGLAVDWAAGLERINRIENELFMNPDSSRVKEIMVAECACYQSTVARLDALKAAGNRVAGANIVLNETAFIKQVGTNRVHVFTDPQPAGFATVDAKGNTVEKSPTRNSLPFVYILDKGSDGVWRLADRHIAGAEQ